MELKWGTCVSEQGLQTGAGDGCWSWGQCARAGIGPTRSPLFLSVNYHSASFSALAFLLLFVSVPECLSMSVSSSLPFFPHPHVSPSLRALLAAQESLALMGSEAYQAL